MVQNPPDNLQRVEVLPPEQERDGPDQQRPARVDRRPRRCRHTSGDGESTKVEQRDAAGDDDRTRPDGAVVDNVLCALDRVKIASATSGRRSVQPVCDQEDEDGHHEAADALVAGSELSIARRSILAKVTDVQPDEATLTRGSTAWCSMIRSSMTNWDAAVGEPSRQ